MSSSFPTARTVLVTLFVPWILLGCDSVPGVANLLGDGDADLVPVPAAGFCGTDGTVRVTLRNQGASDADPSTTRVRFTRGGSFDLDTPEVQSGRIATLAQLGIPAECFAPSCVLEVTVDVNDDVNEADEGNNSTEVSCAPPP